MRAPNGQLLRYFGDRRYPAHHLEGSKAATRHLRRGLHHHERHAGVSGFNGQDEPRARSWYGSKSYGEAVEAAANVPKRWAVISYEGHHGTVSVVVEDAREEARRLSRLRREFMGIAA